MVLLHLLDSERSLGFQVDYTPGVICLAKVFEKEVNLSVVHWIREQLGVNLPECFNQRDPEVPKGGATFDNVDFNKARDNRTWLPPTMGSSLKALCRKVKENKCQGEPIPFDNWDRFEVLWGEIKEERNRAAHTMELVTQGSVFSVCHALRHLHPYFFRKLYQMKEQYRGS